MSKIDKLLTYLIKNRTITKKDAWIKLGLYNSGDAILKLRQRGHEIETRMKTKGKDVFAEYVLIKSVGEKTFPPDIGGRLYVKHQNTTNNN